jgi:eukaryotic-like serine/threonine-protein kinase
VDADRWHVIEALFHRAAALPPAQRSAFLDSESGGDAAVRAEVESLLRTAESEHDLLLDVVGQSAEAFLRSREVEQAGRRVGDYALVRPLGHGGMGMVYLARRADAEFEKLVAIKFARRAFASGPLLRRFRAERQILARLEHPGIARLLDAGATHDGEPFVVMEYVEGEPLDRYAIGHALPVQQRLTLFVQICEAVQYAHQNLVVHRDIKPGNILVTAAGEPKLLDFGIAKLLEATEGEDGEETSHTARLLTPDYASPEQRRGEVVTTATDIYSLGVLLHVLLTGVRPAHDGALPARALSGDLRTIVEKAMRPEPAARYGTAQELADDVRRFVDGRPVVARPATVRYRVRKFLRRNAARVAAGAAVVLALLAIAGFYTVRLARERDAALIAQSKAERVSRFMVDLFQYVDPEANRGATITARELLDAAAAQLDTALLAEPEVRATMMYNIGDVYLNIGLRDDGERLLRSAIAIMESRGGPPDGELAEATFRLGNTQRDPALRDSLFALAAVRADAAGPSARHTGVSARIARAAALDLGGRRAEAEAMLRAEIAALDSAPPADGDLRPFAEFILGNVLYGGGRVLEAEPFARASYERRRDLRGADNPRTLQSLRTYVTVLYGAGKWADAAEHARTLMKHNAQLFGEDHADVANAAVQTARSYRDLGRLAEAESLAALAIANRRSVIGDRPIEVTRWSWGPRAEVLASALRVMARVQADRGRMAEAIETAREAVRTAHAATDGNWAWVSAAELDLAEVLFEAGRVAEAESALTRLLEGNAGYYPDTAMPPAAHRVQLARVLARAGRTSTADSLLGLAMPVLRERLPPVSARIAAGLVTRAEIQLDRGDAAGAERSAREALSMMTALAPDNRAWQAEARVPLGLALARAGAVAEGRALLDSAVRDAASVRGEAHEATRRARAALAAVGSTAAARVRRPSTRG